MRRQPQARQSKSKARIDAFYKLEKATKPRPRDPNLALDGGDQQRIGTKILSVRLRLDKTGTTLEFYGLTCLHSPSYLADEKRFTSVWRSYNAG